MALDDETVAVLRRALDARGSSPPSGPSASSLSVREVQSRLRRGRTVKQVAAEAGVDAAWVERFAPPVRAELRAVVDRARLGRVERARLGPSALPVGEALLRNLADRGAPISADELEDCWRAHQLGDGRWSVACSFPYRGRAVRLSLVTSPAGNEVLAADEAARRWAYVTPTPSVRAATKAQSESRVQRGAEVRSGAKARSGTRAQPVKAQRARAQQGAKRQPGAAVAPREAKTQPRDRVARSAVKGRAVKGTDAGSASRSSGAGGTVRARRVQTRSRVARGVAGDDGALPRGGASGPPGGSPRPASPPGAAAVTGSASQAVPGMAEREGSTRRRRPLTAAPAQPAPAGAVPVGPVQVDGSPPPVVRTARRPVADPWPRSSEPVAVETGPQFRTGLVRLAGSVPVGSAGGLRPAGSGGPLG